MSYVKSLLFDWQNAVFAASIAFWLVYLFISLLSGGPSDHMEAHVDPDSDHDVDIHHDVPISKDVSHEAGHGWGQTLLTYIGFGRCPLSIVLMLLGVSWGFIGLVCNGVFGTLKIIPPIFYFWVSAAVALIVALPFTSAVSRVVARIMPRKGTTAIELDSLVGKTGESSVTIDPHGGRARVLDGYGTQHNIYCRTNPGDPDIPPNTELLVLSRIPENGMFIVKKKPKVIVKN